MLVCNTANSKTFELDIERTKKYAYTQPSSVLLKWTLPWGSQECLQGGKSNLFLSSPLLSLPFIIIIIIINLLAQKHDRVKLHLPLFLSALPFLLRREVALSNLARDLGERCNLPSEVHGGAQPKRIYRMYTVFPKKLCDHVFDYKLN